MKVIKNRCDTQIVLIVEGGGEVTENGWFLADF